MAQANAHGVRLVCYFVVFQFIWGGGSRSIRLTHLWDDSLAHPVHTLHIKVKRKIPILLFGVQYCTMEHKTVNDSRQV